MCTSAAPASNEHRDELPRRVPTHDRVVDDDDALARHLVERVELQAHALLAQLLVGLDERAPDVAVLDQTLARTGCPEPREKPTAAGVPESGIGRTRSASTGASRSQPLAHAHARSRALRPRRDASPVARSRRTRRCRTHRARPSARPGSRAGRRRRPARARRGSTSRTDSAPSRSNAHVSEATTQSSPSRPSESGRKPCGSRKAISVPSAIAVTEYAPARRDIAAGTASVERPRIVGDRRGDQLGVGGRGDLRPLGGELVSQGLGVHEVAVVAQ